MDLLRKWRALLLPATFGVWSLALVGASCDKKSSATPSDPSEPDEQAGPPPAVEELPGVDLSGLSEPAKTTFFRAIDKVQSPCGKPHSLRASLKTDPSCKRSTFAARYIVRLVKAELNVNEIKGMYEARYAQGEPKKLDVRGAAYEGMPNAPIVLVEFFDYGCPHCALMVPLLEEIAAEFPGDVVVYFKHFPLSGHSDSGPAAMAAVAAQKQGKFRDMHRKLMANQDDQSQAALYRYAKEIGLDMARFDADMKNPATRKRVDDDRAAALAAGVEATPTVFVNGRNFSDPVTFDDMKDWITEELAVNR